MATIMDEVRTTEGDKPFLADPFLDWAEGEGVPITEDFGIHLPDLEVQPWARFGCKGGFAHLKGRGDLLSVFVLELEPGGKTEPQQHMFEEVVYCLSGNGSTQVELLDGSKHLPQQALTSTNCRAYYQQRSRLLKSHAVAMH